MTHETETILFLWEERYQDERLINRRKNSLLRKCNAVISAAILVLFLIHGIAGAFQAIGIFPGGIGWLQVLTWIMCALITAHTAIGIKLTADSLRTMRKSGAWYAKENRVFWTRRISGLVLIITIISHVIIFYSSGTPYRLHLFEGPQLTVSLIMAAALLIHIVTNIRPFMIAFGIAGHRFHMRDIMFVFSIILLFCAVAFLIYYLRWNVWWK